MIRVFETTGYFRLDVHCPKLTTLGENTEIVGIDRAFGEERVGQIEHFLEISIPRGQSQVLVEHDHAIAHIVEGDPQFGLTLADLIKESCVLHCDHCLRREALQQRDFLVSERSYLQPGRNDHSQERVVLS